MLISHVEWLAPIEVLFHKCDIFSTNATSPPIQFGSKTYFGTVYDEWVGYEIQGIGYRG